MNRGGKAAVKVDRPGKVVTLVVSAYNPVTWEVTASPGTTLKRVIVAGYHRQAVEGRLNGVEVVEAYREGREGKSRLYAYYNTHSDRLRPAIRAIHEMTGMEVSSYQGVYSAKADSPQVVDAVMTDERLSSDFPRLTPAAELPKFKALTARVVPAGGAVSFGTITEAGPDPDSFRPGPNAVNRIVYDPAGKKYYGLTRHEVHAVDMAKGQSTKLDPGPDVLRVSWPGGIAFDTKRDRLLVVASRDCLYEYKPATGKWRIVTELKGVDARGLVYSAKEDVLYAIGPVRAGQETELPTLFRINAEGAVLNKTTLGGPMFPGVLGRGPAGSVQLADAGDYLLASVVTELRGDDGPAGSESYTYLIDPRAEKTQLVWKKIEPAARPR